MAVDWTKFDECSDEALELWEQCENLLFKYFTLAKRENSQFTIEHLKEMLSEEMIDSIEYDVLYDHGDLRKRI
tara:strand:+ start:59 stop:277 length:219 start_codon:yes stop_codon:yes gene_type:complete